MKGFLYSHFPHRWLDDRAEGTQRLFDGLSLFFESVSSSVDITVKNGRTRSAEELLPLLEDEYGLTIDPSLDENIRRGRIIAKKRAQDWPVTKEQLLEILRAVGIEADIVNYHNEYRLELDIISNEHGISYGEIYSILDGNVRAHIETGVSICTEKLMGILVGASSMQHIEYGNTATERMNKLSYGAVISADVSIRPSQEIVFASA